jgi:hypothetical protein
MNPVSPTTGVRGRKAFMWFMAVLLCAIVGAGIHILLASWPLLVKGFLSAVAVTVIATFFEARLNRLSVDSDEQV